MRFLKRLLIGLVLLVATFLVVVWLQPDDYRLTRQTLIAAPAGAVFAQVNDLQGSKSLGHPGRSSIRTRR